MMNRLRIRQIFARVMAYVMVTVTIVMSMLQVAYASENQSVVKRTNNGQTIRVGFFHFDGYHNMDENGNRSGYGYDFVQQMLRYNNNTAEYVGYDKNWAQMQEMLENGEIDLLTSAQKTPSREEKFDFSEEIGTSAAILTIREGNSQYISGEYETYNGIRVGVIDGNSRNDSFEEFAADKGFTYSLVYYTDMDDMTRDLHNGKNIDAIVTSNLRSINNEWILDKFNVSPFYAMVKKGNKELLAQVNYAIEQMNSNSVGWQDELYDKYYSGTNGDSIALSYTEREFLADLIGSGETIKVLVNPDRAPYSYLEGNEFKGIIPEIFMELAGRLELPYEFVDCKTREEYQSYINNGEIDVILDSRNDMFDEDDRGYKITEPYIDLAYSLIERTDFSGDIQSVAILKYTDANEANMNYFTEGKQVAYYDTVLDCINAVRNKEVDATYMYTYCAQKILAESTTNQLKDTLLPDVENTFSIAV